MFGVLHFCKTGVVHASPPAFTILSVGILSSITASKLGTACNTVIFNLLSIAPTSSIAFALVAVAT